MPTANISIKKIYRNDKPPMVNLLAEDGAKYSDYEGKNVPHSITEGSTVSFEFKQNGQWNNVAGPVQLLAPGLPAANTGGVTAPAGAPAPAAGPDARSLHIMRQNAMGHAVNFVNKQLACASPEDAIGTAKKFVAWYLED